MEGGEQCSQDLSGIPKNRTPGAVSHFAQRVTTAYKFPLSPLDLLWLYSFAHSALAHWPPPSSTLRTLSRQRAFPLAAPSTPVLPTLPILTRLTFWTLLKHHFLREGYHDYPSKMQAPQHNIHTSFQSPYASFFPPQTFWSLVYPEHLWKSPTHG